MPRTNIDAQDLSDPKINWSSTGTAVTETAADASNGNKTASCGRLMLIARNSGGTTRSVTITSAPDNRLGRSGDASRSLAAGETAVFFLTRDGWEQDDAGDGVFYFDADHADVLFSLLMLVA